MEADLSSELGIAGQLFRCSIDLFWLLLQQITTLEEIDEKQRQALQNEFGKLYFWGEGFSPAEGQLDEILRLSTSLRKRTILLLSEVGEVLCSRESGLSRLVDPSCSDAKLQAQCRYLASLIERVRPYANDDDSDSGSGISLDTDLGDPLEVIIGDLRTYIRCLANLTLTLEHPAPDPDDPETEPVPAASFKVPGPALVWCRRIIDKYPCIDTWLAERLGEANWRRFERMNKKLAEAGDEKPLEEEGNSGGSSTIPPLAASAASKGTLSSFAGDSVFDVMSSTQDSTLATTITAKSSPEYCFRAAPQSRLWDTASQATWTSMLSDTGGKDQLRVPAPPTEALNGGAFRCTVCGDKLGGIKNRVAWKRHVFADLQPYICTFADCKLGLTSFSTRKTWADHEFSQHRIQRTWTCPECSARFNEREGFRYHINTSHKDYTEKEKRLALDIPESERTRPLGNPTCPFCATTFDSTSGRFELHVGKHMEEIALAVIPRDLDTGDDGYTSSVESTDPFPPESEARPRSSLEDKRDDHTPQMGEPGSPQAKTTFASEGNKEVGREGLDMSRWTSWKTTMVDPPKQRKIALVGSRGCDKSSLTVQFVEGHFVESYYPTIENTFSRIITYKGQKYPTEIVDTAGQDEYSILNSRHFLGIHGFMIVYSVTSRQSFEIARTIREKILNHLGTDWFPMVIVGTHSEAPPEKRQVHPEEGKQLAAESESSWTEASARFNENVTLAFEMMIAEIEKRRDNGLQEEKRKCCVM